MQKRLRESKPPFFRFGMKWPQLYTATLQPFSFCRGKGFLELYSKKNRLLFFTWLKAIKIIASV